MAGRRIPVQARAVDTIQRALDAAVELLLEQGADRVRLADVTARSGVSNGSLMHHFGSRDGLLAAARAINFARDIDERLQRSRSLATDPTGLAAGIRELAARAASGERDQQRRARFEALALARRLPDLLEVLRAASDGYETEMVQLIEIGQQRGAVAGSVDPRAVAVFAQTYASGRFVDDLMDDPQPGEDWRRLLTAFLGGLLAPQAHRDVRADGRPADAGSADALGPNRAPSVRPELPAFTVGDVDEQRVLAVAAAHRRRGGPDGFVLREVLAEAGVSRSWFARRFIDRDTLLDLVCLQELVAQAHRDTAALEAAFDEAASGDQLLDRLSGHMRALVSEEARELAWDRLELLLAVQVRHELRSDAASVVAATCARVAAAVAAAQRRGVVRSDLSATVIARYLWAAAPLTGLVGSLSQVHEEDLLALALRTNATLLATDSV